MQLGCTIICRGSFHVPIVMQMPYRVMESTDANFTRKHVIDIIQDNSFMLASAH
jgi:hypothetical protein